MRRILKPFLKIITAALILVLAVVLYPHVNRLISDAILDGRYKNTSVMLTQEMLKAGELTAVRYQETGMMEGNIGGAFVGSVSSVKAPYSYEIGLGFSLSEVQLTETETGIEAALPDIRMLYDQFLITGDPQISDIWLLMSEQRYQKIVDQQHEACRVKYLKEHEHVEAAWQAACEQLEELFNTWAGNTVNVTFVHKVTIDEENDQSV